MATNPPSSPSNLNPLQFVLAFAQAVTYKLQSTNARIPILPTGKALNTVYLFNGTIGSGGMSLQEAVNPPNGSGPINLDGAGKQFYSMVSEFTVINLDTTHDLQVYFGETLYTTLTHGGGGFNMTDREIHPIIPRFVCATAGSTCTVFLEAYCYGAST